MKDTDQLDQRALAAARHYMGEAAWPTVVLGLMLGVSYLATVSMALIGVLSTRVRPELDQS